ncbi:hypothetical protein EYD10_14599 [Varanus komodoensis]|nr:hypothetical protein EYD10_14599 [Varanus komodoensis]
MVVYECFAQWYYSLLCFAAISVAFLRKKEGYKSGKKSANVKRMQDPPLILPLPPTKDPYPRAMQSTRRGRLSIVPGTSTLPQDNVTNSPSISGDLRLLHMIDCGDQLLCCQFNNDGTRVAAGMHNGSIKVYSVNDGSLHHVLADNETTTLGLPLTSLRYMPRGPAHNADVLLATYSGGKVKLWHVSSHTCLRTLTEDRQTLISSFNPSGSKFITGGAGSGIYMYDAQTWDRLRTFQPSDSPNLMDGHTSRVYALAFFPENDDRFISGGWDDTVQVMGACLPHGEYGKDGNFTGGPKCGEVETFWGQGWAIGIYRVTGRVLAKWQHHQVAFNGERQKNRCFGPLAEAFRS